MDGVHARTLKRALEIVATKDRLAAELDLPLPELDAYLAGEKPLPNEKFIAALDIVAKRKGE